jgi:hypothetical protein
MSFIPGYTHDIFISYAHVDNIAFPGQADGWIAQFYKNLNLMLAKRFGRLDSVKIWWDSRKLDGSVLFDQSIEDGIRQSAVMICLHSPGYLASPYCKKELSLFYEKAQKEKTGLKIGERSRLINVLLNNIPHKQWPQELSGTSGFHLYDAKDSEFGDTIETLSPEFRIQMQKIRDAVWNLLNDFPKDQSIDTVIDQPVISKTPKDKNAFNIYFAEVADTLRTPRKRIITELEKKGFTIITGPPPPDEAVAHERIASDALANSDLSIHLLDEFTGREIIGTTDEWYPQKQTELALKAGKPQMIWMPTEANFTNIEEEKYKLFLEKIEKGETTTKGYELVRGSKSTLTQEIIDFAEQVKSQQSQKTVDKGNVSVLVDTHFSDQLYALDLSKKLLENNIQPFINPQEDDPRKNINLMGERLSQVRKLIFMYGSVSKEWVLERMSAALQLIITNNYPIEDFFIYMAPPYKEANNISINQRFLKVNVIDSSKSESLDKNEMQQFLNALKTTAA